MKNYILPLGFIVSLFVVSCAKSPSGGRAVKQTQSQPINAGVTNQSNNLAQQSHLFFEVVSVEHSELATDGSITVTSEIRRPDGQITPITTTHTASTPQAQGVMNYDQNTQLDVRTKCFNTDCDKYIMLVTTVRGGASVHQTSIISNRSQDFFYVYSKHYTMGAFFRSVDEVQLAFPNH